MATLEEAWMSLLTNGTQLDAIIDGRVYPDRLPENVTLPAAVFIVPSDIPFMAHDGDAGLTTAVVQTDFWSTSRLECAQMREAARADLLGHVGDVAGLNVKITRLSSVPDNDPGLTLKRVICEFTVQYKAAV